jgi:hypothetical protein
MERIEAKARLQLPIAEQLGEPDHSATVDRVHRRDAGRRQDP